MNASRYVRRGGGLVYATCAINRDENEGVRRVRERERERERGQTEKAGGDAAGPERCCRTCTTPTDSSSPDGAAGPRRSTRVRFYYQRSFGAETVQALDRTKEAADQAMAGKVFPAPDPKSVLACPGRMLACPLDERLVFPSRQLS